MKKKKGKNKFCKKTYNKIYSDLHKKERKAYDKIYRQTSKGKEVKKKSNKKYDKKNPEKHKAHYTLRNAIASGKIIKSKVCSICGETDCVIEGHHEDYSKPLEVIWCCIKCHKELHIFLKRKKKEQVKK